MYMPTNCHAHKKADKQNHAINKEHFMGFNHIVKILEFAVKEKTKYIYNKQKKNNYACSKIVLFYSFASGQNIS